MKLTTKTLKIIPVDALADSDGFRALTNQDEEIHGQKTFDSLCIERDEDKADDSLITIADIMDAKNDVPLGCNEKITITPEMAAERTLTLPYPIADGTNYSVKIATEGSGWLELTKDFEITDKTAIKWHESVPLMAGDIVTVEYQAKRGDVTQ